MVTGRRAFPGSTLTETLLQVIQSRSEPIESLAPGTPADLIAVIDQCLQKDRSERYQKTGDLLDDLRGLQSLEDADHLHKAGTTLHTSVGSSLRRRSSRFHPGRLTASAAVALILVTGVSTWWFFGRAPRYDSIAVLPF